MFIPTWKYSDNYLYGLVPLVHVTATWVEHWSSCRLVTGTWKENPVSGAQPSIFTYDTYVFKKKFMNIV